jgi:endonuclease/exonuclease/phosphatase family metal-dependent hydrolase
VSYNVHGLRDDRAALVEVIRDLDPDVLILQEAPRRLRWRTRNAHLAQDVDLVYATGGAATLGNVILINLRVRILDTWAVRYPLTPGRHMRGAAFARCEVAEGPFVVVGSHLATDPTERPAQARQLRKEIDAGVPTIVGVDLNEPPGGPSWGLLADGLVDAAGADAAGSYPAEQPGGPAARQRLDAILVDPRITVSAYRVADPPAARRASDHLPVVAELALPA